jgi:hypothetical protein
LNIFGVKQKLFQFQYKLIVKINMKVYI